MNRKKEVELYRKTMNWMKKNKKMKKNKNKKIYADRQRKKSTKTKYVTKMNKKMELVTCRKRR